MENMIEGSSLRMIGGIVEVSVHFEASTRCQLMCKIPLARGTGTQALSVCEELTPFANSCRGLRACLTWRQFLLAFP